jgi:hypothetical protein
MPDHSYIETPQQQHERRERQNAWPAVENDPMALARLRNVIAETIDRPGMDDPWHQAAPIAAVFPSAHFEREVNEHGVPMRRLVVTGEWEMDPAKPRDADLSRRPDGQLLEWGDGRWHEVAEPPTATGPLAEIHAWLATYPPMPDVVTGDPEASIVVRLRKMLGISAPYTGEKWDQPICCERHDDAGEAEACCEYCPNRLPLRIVGASE